MSVKFPQIRAAHPRSRFCPEPRLFLHRPSLADSHISLAKRSNMDARTTSRPSLFRAK